jgi:hypothetical protein
MTLVHLVLAACTARFNHIMTHVNRSVTVLVGVGSVISKEYILSSHFRAHISWTLVIRTISRWYCCTIRLPCTVTIATVSVKLMAGLIGGTAAARVRQKTVEISRGPLLLGA